MVTPAAERIWRTAPVTSGPMPSPGMSVMRWAKNPIIRFRIVREDVIGDAVGKISSVVLELLSRGDVPTPDALRLLLRAYAATGRDDFRNALELGLARAVEIAGDSSSESAAPWLVLIGEASDASDDERLRMSASNLAFKAKMVWGATRSIGLSAASVDACL